MDKIRINQWKLVIKIIIAVATAILGAIASPDTDRISRQFRKGNSAKLLEN